MEYCWFFSRVIDFVNEIIIFDQFNESDIAQWLSYMHNLTHAKLGYMTDTVYAVHFRIHKDCHLTFV